MTVGQAEREEWRALVTEQRLDMLPSEALIASIRHLAQRLLDLTEPHADTGGHQHQWSDWVAGLIGEHRYCLCGKAEMRPLPQIVATSQTKWGQLPESVRDAAVHAVTNTGWGQTELVVVALVACAVWDEAEFHPHGAIWQQVRQIPSDRIPTALWEAIQAVPQGDGPRNA